MQNDEIKVGDKVRTHFLFHHAVGIVEKKEPSLLGYRYLIHYAAIYPDYISEGRIRKFRFQLTKINHHSDE